MEKKAETQMGPMTYLVSHSKLGQVWEGSEPGLGIIPSCFWPCAWISPEVHLGILIRHWETRLVLLLGNTPKEQSRVLLSISDHSPHRISHTPCLDPYCPRLGVGHL